MVTDDLDVSGFLDGTADLALLWYTFWTACTLSATLVMLTWAEKGQGKAHMCLGAFICLVVFATAS